MPNDITFVIEDDDGEEVEYSLPAKFEVCDCCGGEGKHVNPNIECDGGGFTYSEWQEACQEDNDFAANYMSGKYDVTCYECKGLRVVPVVNESILTTEQKEVYDRYLEYQENEYNYAAERASERRMGC